MGVPRNSRNCLGAPGVAFPAAIRVPRPAAGRMTKTRIGTGVYRELGADNCQPYTHPLTTTARGHRFLRGEDCLLGQAATPNHSVNSLPRSDAGDHAW